MTGTYNTMLSQNCILNTDERHSGVSGLMTISCISSHQTSIELFPNHTEHLTITWLTVNMPVSGKVLSANTWAPLACGQLEKWWRKSKRMYFSKFVVILFNVVKWCLIKNKSLINPPGEQITKQIDIFKVHNVSLYRSKTIAQKQAWKIQN